MATLSSSENVLLLPKLKLRPDADVLLRTGAFRRSYSNIPVVLDRNNEPAAAAWSSSNAVNELSRPAARFRDSGRSGSSLLLRRGASCLVDACKASRGVCNSCTSRCNRAISCRVGGDGPRLGASSLASCKTDLSPTKAAASALSCSNTYAVAVVLVVRSVLLPVPALKRLRFALLPGVVSDSLQVAKVSSPETRTLPKLCPVLCTRGIGDSTHEFISPAVCRSLLLDSIAGRGVSGAFGALLSSKCISCNLAWWLRRVSRRSATKSATMSGVAAVAGPDPPSQSCSARRVCRNSSCCDHVQSLCTLLPGVQEPLMVDSTVPLSEVASRSVDSSTSLFWSPAQSGTNSESIHLSNADLIRMHSIRT